MDFRLEKLVAAFAENGWKFIEVVNISQDWWFSDIIQFASIWSPVGKSLYMVLRTDPALTKKEVWCVDITFELPKDNRYIPIRQVSLKDVKRTDLVALVKFVNEEILK